MCARTDFPAVNVRAAEFIITAEMRRFHDLVTNGQRDAVKQA
jgi:hypothetical protein